MLNLGVFWHILINKKSYFGELIDIQNFEQPNFSRQCTSLKNTNDFILSDEWKKRENWSKLKIFVTSFFLRFIFSFLFDEH